MQRTFVSLVLLFFTSISQATTCDTAFMAYWQPIDQYLEATPPWEGYRPSNAPLVAVDGSLNIYLRNFSAELVKKIDPSAAVCSNVSKITKLTPKAIRKIEAFEIYPYEPNDRADPIIQSLAKGLGHPFIALGTPANPMFEPPSTWIPLNWIWAVHESFHLYQELVFQEPHGNVSLSDCESRIDWKDFLNAEFEDWKKIGPFLTNTSHIHGHNIGDSLKTILERREAIERDKILLGCLQKLRQNERNEGTARFVDIHSRMNVGGVLAPKRWEQEILPFLSIDPNRPFPFSQLPFYYSTGTLWCEVLNILSPDKWQISIEKGNSPEVVAHQLFSELPTLH